mgnify:CR=1 FL=1
MKLTKSTLKQIIKEELSKALNEVTEMQPDVQMDDEMEWALERGEVTEDELMMAAKYNLPWKSQENRQTLNFLKSFEQDLDQHTSAGKHGTARQAINKARKDGLIDKNTWRKLRRKHHKRKKWAGALSKDPRANAIDQAEKLYRKGKRAEAKKAAKWWLKRNPKAGGNYGRIARQIINAPD